LSDLRESGTIEQDADIVGLLIRDKYYAEDEEAKKEAAGSHSHHREAAKRPHRRCSPHLSRGYTRFEDAAVERSDPQ
jgi:replicative DNA helicase